MNTSESNNKTNSLIGQELGVVNSSGRTISTPVTSEEVTKHVKAATNPPQKQLKALCDLKEELQQVPLRRNEETNGLIQGSSGASNYRSDTCQMYNCTVLSLLSLKFLNQKNFNKCAVEHNSISSFLNISKKGIFCKINMVSLKIGWL